MTESKAALWTDGRYFLQAAAQLDSNWTLMKDGACLETKQLHCSNKKEFAVDFNAFFFVQV